MTNIERQFNEDNKDENSDTNEESLELVNQKTEHGTYGKTAIKEYPDGKFIVYYQPHHGPVETEGGGQP